jgi:hypothetical protein
MRPTPTPAAFNEATRWQGPWSAVTAYEVGDAVSYSGASFVALLDHTNQAPSAAADTVYWGRIALKGDTGPQGDPGDQGIQGEPGLDGADGAGTPPNAAPPAIDDTSSVGTDTGQYANEDHTHAKHPDQASAAALAAHNHDDRYPLREVAQNTQTVDYTLVLADSTKVVEMNTAAASVLTVPPNASVAFPVGTIIEVHQYGAGQVTITPGAGVTILSASGLKLVSQFSTASLRKRATDEWVASGDLEV